MLPSSLRQTLISLFPVSGPNNSFNFPFFRSVKSAVYISVKRHCLAEKTKLCLLNFHVISPPNIQLNWIKRFYRAKEKRYFGEIVQDYKDGIG